MGSQCEDVSGFRALGVQFARVSHELGHRREETEGLAWIMRE